jgi:formimidoylglutamate deiminase
MANMACTLFRLTVPEAWRHHPTPPARWGCKTRMACAGAPNRPANFVLWPLPMRPSWPTGLATARPAPSCGRGASIRHPEPVEPCRFAVRRDALLPTDGHARAVAVGRTWPPQRSATRQPRAGRRGGRCPGPLLPGMPNLHSHAFQRAFAGLTEYRGHAGGTRQLLELAQPHVPLCRRASRPISWRPLPPGCTWRCWRRATPRSANSTTCTTTRMASPMPTMPRCRIACCVRRTCGHRHDAAARAVPDQRLWRQATARRANARFIRSTDNMLSLLERLRPPHKRKGLFWAWLRIRCARCRPTPGEAVQGITALECAGAHPHPHRRADAGGG